MTDRVRMSENGAQLFARLEGRRSLRDIEQRIFPEDDGPRQGDVVELHGTEGTGKTETLYHLVTHCILPVQFGGLEVEVMYVDTDYHFDMLRLVAVLEGRLADGTEDECSPSEAEAEERARCCLGRLSVVHCCNSVQLLLTLHYLESSFCSRPSLCLLVVDSISAFYWVDRSNGGESFARQEANLKKCAELLHRLGTDYGVVVFATTHAIMRNYSSAQASEEAASSSSSSSWRRMSATGATDFDKPYLCRAWQRIVTHRLLLSKSNPANGNSPVFSGACTTVRTRGVKKFSFHITDRGIVFL